MTVHRPVQTHGPFTKESGTPRTCGSKRTCGEMQSCEEARFYLLQCGVSRLDRDHDGVPCETVCR